MKKFTESFVFYKGFYETLKKFPEQDKARAYEALCECAFDEATPDDYEFPLNAVLDQMMISVKSAKERYNRAIENGKKGGRTTREQMDLKPIETHYNGYRFRSRLEARWAVFFDALGIKYEYEQEGYVLHGGLTYLPDFKVYLEKPNGDSFYIFAEVKGVMTDIDYEKAELLSKNEALIILGCVPKDTEEYLQQSEASDYVLFSSKYICGNNSPFVFTTDEKKMNAALQKARKARFEFGESD